MNFDAEHETTMSEAFAHVGYRCEETPQRAAERIWRETKHDPVETMKRFDEWAREKPERMLAVLGNFWPRAVRGFLDRQPQTPGAWKDGKQFFRLMRRAERNSRYHGKGEAARARELAVERRARVDSEVLSANTECYRRGKDRKRRGVKVVRAEVDVKTGLVVNLIDKEFGPFAHIRINGLRLPEVTTGQALAYCDAKTVDVRFIRALCQLIPDPRKPIGEQWTAEIIIQAKQASAVVAA